VKSRFDIRGIGSNRDMRRAVLALVWPVVLQNFFWTLMFFADTAMVGRLGETSLSAVGIAGPLLWSISVVIMAVAVGTTATVARAIGEGDKAKAQANAATGMLLALLGGVVVTAVALVYAEPLVSFFLDEPAVAIVGAFYFRTVISTVVFSFLAMIAASVLRASGDTRTPMIVSVVSNILNFAGNYVLIFGKLGFPRFGVLGAGYATALARFVEGGVLLLYLSSGRSAVRVHLRSFALVSKESFKRVLRVALPAAAEPLGVHTGFLAFMKIVALLGTTAYAAHRVAIAIESLGFMAADAFAIVTATIVGQSLGAKKKDLAGMGTKEAIKVGLLIMGAVGLVFLTVPGLLARIVTDKPDLIRLAIVCLMIGAAEQPLMAIAGVFRGVFQGAGDTKIPAIVGSISVWAIRVPVAYLLAVVLRMGLAGIWVTTALDWGFRTLVFLCIYRRGKWKDREV
jgi:putative MATE family efflux protein